MRLDFALFVDFPSDVCFASQDRMLFLFFKFSLAVIRRVTTLFEGAFGTILAWVRNLC